MDFQGSIRAAGSWHFICCLHVLGCFLTTTLGIKQQRRDHIIERWVCSEPFWLQRLAGKCMCCSLGNERIKKPHNYILGEEGLSKLHDILGPEETFSEIYNSRTKLQVKKVANWSDFTSSPFLLGIVMCASLAGLCFCCARPPRSLPKANKSSLLLHLTLMAAARNVISWDCCPNLAISSPWVPSPTDQSPSRGWFKAEISRLDQQESIDKMQTVSCPVWDAVSTYVSLEMISLDDRKKGGHMVLRRLLDLMSLFQSRISST